MSWSAKTTFNSSVWAVGLVGLALLLSGCHPHGHTRGKDKPEKKDEGPEDESVTLWTEKTELFMEYPPMVAGKPTDFVIHLTHLKSPFQPVRRGQLILTFSDGKTRTVARANSLLRTGIFKPRATLQRAGTYTLTLDLVGAAWRDRLTVKNIRVSQPGKPQAPVDDPNKSAIERFDYLGQEIGFLKEQQWIIPFETRILKKRPIPRSHQTYGVVLAPAGSQRIVKASAGGLITELSENLKPHQRVRSQDPALTILAHSTGTESYGQLSAAVSLARNRLQAAQARYAALAALVKSGLEPKSKLLVLKSDVSVSRASLKVEQAKLAAFRKLQQGKRGVRITVPIGGTIKRVMVTKGAFVSVGQPLFEVMNPNKFMLKVFYPLSLQHRISELVGLAIRPGDKMPVQRLIAKPRLLNELDRGSNSLVLLYTLPKRAASWFKGQELKVYLQFKSKLGFRVPASAIVNDNGRSIIYLQKEGESLFAHPVQVRALDHDWRQITGNLVDGLRVVTLGSYTIYLSTLGTKKVGHGHSH